MVGSHTEERVVIFGREDTGHAIVFIMNVFHQRSNPSQRIRRMSYLAGVGYVQQARKVLNGLWDGRRP